MSSWPRVAVVGGSIGGLTAALVLRELGCEVDVYERATAALKARGAGIALHPMTVKYFTEHQPLDTDRVTIKLPWLRYLRADGSLEHESEMNYQFSSWNTVYRALLSSFEPARYHLGTELASFDQDAHGVTLRFTDGGTTRADMLVCADGIASTCRPQLDPDARPEYAGYVAWRGTVVESELTRDAFERLGDAITYGLLPAGHALIYPIPSFDGDLRPGKRLANLVWYHNYAAGDELDDLMTDRAGTLHSVTLPPGAMRSKHVDWARAYAREHMAPAIAEVVERAHALFIQAIYDISVRRMASGRVCLIGDGAFAVRPHAAAGTAKACADGWALAESLELAGGDVIAALESWEPQQLALGQQLLSRTRHMGDGSQFRRDWVPGDPDLRLGLYGPGR